MLHKCDLISLETDVRDIVGEAQPKLFTSAFIHRQLNNEASRGIRNVLEADENYFDTTKTYTPTSATLALPRNCWKPRAVMVLRDSKWWPSYWTDSASLWQIQGSTGTTQYHKAVRFEGSNLIIEPGYSNITQLKLLYSRVPAPMIYGLAQAGAATTITFPSTASLYDDIYIGDEIETLSGTGSGQTNTVSDYVGSTKVATVTTWGTNPDSTTYFSTLLPDPLNKWPQLVAMGAAMRCMNRRRDPELFQMILAQYELDAARFTSSISPRQTEQARSVHFIPREDD